MRSTEASDALLRRAAGWLVELAQHWYGFVDPTPEQVRSSQEWRDAQELYAIIRARKKARALNRVRRHP